MTWLLSWLEAGVPRWACLMLCCACLIWVDWQRGACRESSESVCARLDASHRRITRAGDVQALRDASRRAYGRPYVARHRRAEDAGANRGVHARPGPDS